MDNNSKQNLVLTIINKYLEIMDKEQIQKIEDLPQIEKSLFINKKIGKYIKDNIENWKLELGTKEISYYERDRLKNYNLVLFKKLIQSCDLEPKSKYTLKSTTKNNFERVPILFV
jgi:hypothetical protein